MRPIFHPSLVNGRYGDPTVYVETLFEKHSLLFDVGEIASLSARKIRRVDQIFVSHAHIDHFVGFDHLLRLLIGRSGAGRTDLEARAPAVLNLAKARLLIFSFGSTSSGIPFEWAATPDAPGVNLLPDLCEVSALQLANQVMAIRRPGDLIVVSIHWGSNWGYHIPDEQKVFARALIDEAGVSIVHGHSSHHPRAIEIYRDRLILYGCGDFLNDYEGIRGYERYRDDLALMYFADLDPASGSLQALKLVPLQIKNFRLSNSSWRDIEWIQQTLDGECQQFGTRVILDSERQLVVIGPGVRT
jgi:poly-gamma-glutamate capsule biosynthesis protein CapA/YwtB (metallophosphatase superfamily)